jgi:superoxide dismutase, Fe-Mn family
MPLLFKLPPLPYDFNELEPVISSETLNIHYSKHHAGYVNNLNSFLEQYSEAEQKQDLSKMISLSYAIKFHGGGHVNHTLFWENLIGEKKGGGKLNEGILSAAITKEFGSLDTFIQAFNAKAVAVQGSGWGWLGWDAAKKRLEIATTENHDLPQIKGLTPLLCIDVWEHAYYLQYRNARGDFLKNIWKIVNWNMVENRLIAAQK